MNTFKPTWLYIKQHNITGLKYFGKTTRNPYSYIGSGTYWRRHLKLHGRDVTTLWCQLFNSEDEIKKFALEFSNKNNIVESKEWANLRPEDGLEGGSIPGHKRSIETREKLSIIASKRIQSEESNRKRSAALKGVPRPRSEEHQANLTKSLKGKIPWNKGLKLEDEKYKGGRKNKGKQPRLGAVVSKETKIKQSIKAKNREKYLCPHCGKLVAGSNFFRWHGNNCKFS
ncbi:MAG TPA: NUMOD3 domain-containing DNA-binding protein [Methanosarcina sp.]|nr:NUMOD3 domain-containing DNA-binding protein [Methanosarcina sp.]